MIASGVSVRHSVSPGWPFWPPGFLPEGSRRLLTRTVFFSPSLDGGLPLLLLFKLSRRSNSAMRACIAAISAAWRASSANNRAMRSYGDSCSSVAGSTHSFESVRRSHVKRFLRPRRHAHAKLRHHYTLRPPIRATGDYLGSYESTKGLSLNNRIGRIESGWRQRRNERIHKGE